MNTTRIILESFLQYRSRDKLNTLKDLKNLIWILSHLSDCLYTHKISLKPFQFNLEVLLVKMSFHGSTILQLFDGTNVISHKKNVISRLYDLSSIFILMRGLIENYFMLYYLNFDPKTEEQGFFRNLLYEASGLNIRQGYETQGITSIQKKKKEKEKLDIVLNKIKENSYFKKLPIDKQKEIIKKLPPRELGIEQLIKRTGISSKQFLLLWKLSSNYAHSEFLSVIQLQDYLKNSNELKETLFSILNQALIVFALIIKDLVKNFKSLELIYNMLDNESITKIDFWSDLAKKMK